MEVKEKVYKVEIKNSFLPNWHGALPSEVKGSEIKHRDTTRSDKGLCNWKDM
jgi:hypothetical protein